MTSIAHPAPTAPTGPHLVIHRCNHCDTLCGTLTALRIHSPRNRCRSSKPMVRAGCWQGMANVWWSPDCGWDDPTEGLPFSPSQVSENTRRKLGQNGDLGPTRSPRPFVQVPHTDLDSPAFHRVIVAALIMGAGRKIGRLLYILS